MEVTIFSSLCNTFNRDWQEETEASKAALAESAQQAADMAARLDGMQQAASGQARLVQELQACKRQIAQLSVYSRSQSMKHGPYRSML